MSRGWCGRMATSSSPLSAVLVVGHPLSQLRRDRRDNGAGRRTKGTQLFRREDVDDEVAGLAGMTGCGPLELVEPGGGQPRLGTTTGCNAGASLDPASPLQPAHGVREPRG